MIDFIIEEAIYDALMKEDGFDKIVEEFLENKIDHTMEILETIEPYIQHNQIVYESVLEENIVSDFVKSVKAAAHAGPKHGYEYFRSRRAQEAQKVAANQKKKQSKVSQYRQRLEAAAARARSRFAKYGSRLYTHGLRGVVAGVVKDIAVRRARGASLAAIRHLEASAKHGFNKTERSRHEAARKRLQQEREKAKGLLRLSRRLRGSKKR